VDFSNKIWDDTPSAIVSWEWRLKNELSCWERKLVSLTLKVWEAGGGITGLLLQTLGIFRWLTQVLKYFWCPGLRKKKYYVVADSEEERCQYQSRIMSSSTSSRGPHHSEVLTLVERMGEVIGISQFFPSHREWVKCPYMKKKNLSRLRTSQQFWPNTGSPVGVRPVVTAT
jgi:hypothetical protein